MLKLGVEMECSPTITNDLVTACWSESCYEVDLCSFHDVQTLWYWSSSSWGRDVLKASVLRLDDGYHALGTKTDAFYYVWPVRGGQ
jgi:hypothetical protein